MNRTRFMLLGFVALLVSAVVTVLIYRELNLRMNPTLEDPAMIVVAAEPVQLGSRLESHQLKMVPWPKGAPLQGSFSSVEEVIGRGVIVPMLANEPIMESKLAPTEAGAGMTSAIPEGMRAVSVKVNDVIGVAGFVIPGSRVDVIAIGSPDDSGDNEVSKVILENVEVLAAGQNIERDVNGKPVNVQVVTMMVTPEDTQKLALATLDGRIQLALRNPMDLEQANPDPFKKASLYEGPSSAPPPIVYQPPVRRVAKPEPRPEPVVEQPKPKVFNVELIQGAERKNLSFEKPISR